MNSKTLQTWWRYLTAPWKNQEKFMTLAEQINESLKANSLTLDSLQTELLEEMQTDAARIESKIQALIDRTGDATNADLEPLLAQAQAQGEKITTLKSALSALKNTVDAVDTKLEETGQELPPVEVPLVEEEPPPPVEGEEPDGPAGERYVGFAKGKKK